VLKRWKLALFAWSTTALFAVGAFMGTALAQKAVPQSRIAPGEAEVKQLLLLMDTNKNGKISRQEFVNFMAAEFDRLDVDKSGELDVKELAQSQLRASRPPVGKQVCECLDYC
jgi:hypothetical protein